MRRVDLPEKNLYYLYRKKLLTTGQIAKYFGVSKDVVRFRLNDYGIKRWSQSEINGRSALGRIKSEATCKKLSDSLKGNQNAKGAIRSKETRAKIRKALTGKKLSEEHRKSLRGERPCQQGKNHHNWSGGRIEDRGHGRTVQYKCWRLAVFERDNFICQLCNKRGGKLNAHHIKGWKKHKELRFDVNNGITLCTKCHGKTKFKERVYEKRFYAILDQKRTEVEKLTADSTNLQDVTLQGNVTIY